MIAAGIEDLDCNLEMFAARHLVTSNVVQYSQSFNASAIGVGQQLPIPVHLSMFGIVDIEVVAFHWCQHPASFDVQFTAAAMVPSE